MVCEVHDIINIRDTNNIIRYVYEVKSVVEGNIVIEPYPYDI